MNIPLNILALFCILPSGLFPFIKLICILFLGVWSLFNMNKLKFAKYQILSFSVLLIYLFIWLMQGVLSVKVNSMEVLGYFFNVLMVPLLLIFYQALVRKNSQTSITFLKIFIHSVAINSVIKFSLLFLIMFELIDINFFEATGVSYQIFHQDVFSTRLTFSSDYFLPLASFCVVYFLGVNNKVLSNKVLYFYIIFFSLCALMTYIRAVWVLQSLVLICLLFRNIRFSMVVICLITAAFSYIFISFSSEIDVISRAILTKFYDLSSLSTKQSQVTALINGINQSPLFGHGAASYLVDYIRNPERPYLYEAQLILIFYQMGLIGGLFYFMFLFSGFFRKPNSNYGILVLIIFLLYLMVFATNPILLAFNGFLFILIPWILFREKVK